VSLPLFAQLETHSLIGVDNQSLFRTNTNDVIFSRIVRNSQVISDTCKKKGQRKYSSEWQKNTAKRNLMAHAQWEGVRQSVKSLVKYAQLQDISLQQAQAEFTSLVSTTCSSNMSVISKKMLQQYFSYQWGLKKQQHENSSLIENYANQVNLVRSHAAKYDLSKSLFQSFCSWGNQERYPRMLAAFLQNELTFATLTKNWSKKEVNNKKFGVACQDHFCKPVSHKTWFKLVPKSISFSSYQEDAASLYCQYFKSLSRKPFDPIDQVRKLIVQKTENQILTELAFFISEFTKVEDVKLLRPELNKKNIVRDITRELFTNWLTEQEENLLNKLAFEDGIRVSLLDSKEVNTLEVNVSHGQFDSITSSDGKLQADIWLNLNAQFVNWFKNEWLNHDPSDQKKTAWLRSSLRKHIWQHNDKLSKIRIFESQKVDMTNLLVNGMLDKLHLMGGNLTPEHSQSHDFAIKLKLYFGAFALKYLQEKRQSLQLENIHQEQDI
jgi:hypothetical protein